MFIVGRLSQVPDASRGNEIEKEKWETKKEKQRKKEIEKESVKRVVLWNRFYHFNETCFHPSLSLSFALSNRRHHVSDTSIFFLLLSFLQISLWFFLLLSPRRRICPHLEGKGNQGLESRITFKRLLVWLRKRAEIFFTPFSFSFSSFFFVTSLFSSFLL